MSLETFLPIMFAMAITTRMTINPQTIKIFFIILIFLYRTALVVGGLRAKMQRASLLYIQSD